MGAQVVTPVAWDQPRWLSILERMEYRQADVGLRFWGPPLWLEVTMSGPDSDAWSTAGASAPPSQSWDWQSTEPCAVAMEMANAGADDDCLLGAASEYTVENLILNATHEIGEWLRFDAQRPFAAHGQRCGTDPEAQQSPDGLQGNGLVSLQVDFGNLAGTTSSSGDASFESPDPEGQLDRMALRVSALAASWRFSYLPERLISFGHRGPVITDSSVVPEVVWELPWCIDALRCGGAGTDDFVIAVQREVHRMLVLFEAHRICEAFYVDDVRPWRLKSPLVLVGATTVEDDRSGLTVAITYDQ